MAHNFKAVFDSDPAESEWVIGERLEYPDAGGFAVITERADGRVLVIGDRVYPGTSEDGTQWIFTWVEETFTQNVEVHTSGYRYAKEVTIIEAIAYELTFEADTASGARSYRKSVETVHTESDLWSAEWTARAVGLTPSGLWLQDASHNPILNEADDPDCTDAECLLSFTEVTEGRSDIALDLTEFADAAGAYEWLEKVGTSSSVPGNE